MFHGATGKPVHQFVLERRVQRARWRLLQGDASITDVALETGFAHGSHVARCMQRLLGLSLTDIIEGTR